ncbi:DUF429 domain-containing protein [Spirosoma rhododendri]|uniref:DUF429 domain-containing protein n=1 Tax=Spirosoma rhododendri TaxID=2728024 RepID=A0A7L5DTE1_9BACT|nr:DUF429 domain-containing protein [Spirosoma rhododendri]QJD80563.1 DUF429 domain-containing protein [Spirosoma rhododendri]
MYLGIDGCRGGWIVAMIDEDKTLSYLFVSSLDDLPEMPIRLALIDMPLEFADHAYRPCEVAAQKLLGPKKRSSVFLTPHRSAVYATDYAEANRMNRLHLGNGLSIQSWNICPKIKEAARFIATRTDLPLVEAHPELCFYFLNNRQPLLSKKALPAGTADRLTLIAAQAADYPAVIANTMRVTKRKDVKPDDIIDATILAIRASASDIQVVPADKRIGDRGAILY